MTKFKQTLDSVRGKLWGQLVEQLWGQLSEFNPTKEQKDKAWELLNEKFN